MSAALAALNSNPILCLDTKSSEDKADFFLRGSNGKPTGSDKEVESILAPFAKKNWLEVSGKSITLIEVKKGKKEAPKSATKEAAKKEDSEQA